MVEPTKKCPYCYTRVKTELTKCDYCNKKIGPPDKFNIAERPVNVIGYVMAIASIGAFGYFMFWLFFLKDKG